MDHRCVEGTVHKYCLLTEGCRDYYYFFTMTYIRIVRISKRLIKNVESRMVVKAIVGAIPCRLQYATSCGWRSPGLLETGLRLSRHPGPHPQNTSTLNNLAGSILLLLAVCACLTPDGLESYILVLEGPRKYLAEAMWAALVTSFWRGR